MERLNYEYSNSGYVEGGFGTVAKAIYKESIVPTDRGNPFIEAIPLPLKEEYEIIRHFNVGLPSYSPKEMKYDEFERKLLVQQVEQLRFFLPFELGLEQEFYNTLIRSYRLRKLGSSFVDGQRTVCLTGNVGEAANSGFAILGYPGCGKSSSLRLLVNRYPQVIYHDINGTKIPQILYIAVSCVPNSNFSVLYDSIAKEIDKALGVDNYYKKVSKRNLGRKMDFISELIQGFNIGVIFLDEIQLMDFNANRESSFESLMVITNTTKVSFCVLGIRDGYTKLFKSGKNARRVGRLFEASKYCSKKIYCFQMLKNLFKYQWFDDYIEPTEEIMNAIYEETKGLICLIINLYIAIHDEYLSTKPRPKINAKFIKKVFNDRYKNLHSLLEEIDEPNAQMQIQQILNDNETVRMSQLDEIQQSQTMETLLSNTKEIDVSDIIHTVVSSISILNKEWTQEHIELVCKSVIGSKKHSELDPGDIAEKTLKRLKEETTKKKKKIRNVDMINAALKEIKDAN